MNTPLRLAMSTSALIYTMDRSMLEAAFGLQSKGPVQPVSREINNMMCDFLLDVAASVNKYPVDALELYFSPTLDRVQLAEAIRPILQKEVWSVHGPYGKYLDTSSPDPIAKECTVKGYREAILFAKDLDAKVVVVHPGHKTWHDVSRDIRMNCSIEAIRKIADIAGEHNITLAVEPMPNDEIGCSMDEVLHIVEQVNSPVVGINFDTNHLYPATSIPSYIRMADGLIKSIHISDQEDAERHWLPFMGNLDWQAVLDALVLGGYSGPLVYETHIRDAVNTEDAVDAVCRNYEKLALLIPNNLCAR